MRLDQAVAARHPEISRRKARELIAEKRVFVNDRPVAVASREVSERDRITIAGELPDLEILREMRDWVAVNKPAGMPAQPMRGRKALSLEELMRARYGEVFLVHRIDTWTSGVMVFARTRPAAADLSALFATRAVRKVYLAVVEGAIREPVTIDTPIAGKEARTIIHPLRSLEGTTLVEAEILTGRTHQIRIHMQSVKHPVCGDRRYGATRSAARMLLHAWKLEHEYFGGTLTAPLPNDFPSL